MTILRNLLEQSRKRRTALEAIMRSSPEQTVIFTGAGMSTGKELYPGWGDLVARLAVVCEVPNFTKESNYLDVAEEAQSKNYDAYKQVIFDFFREYRPTLQVAVSLLRDLNSRIYVTTNWDNSLELQLKGRKAQLHVLDECRIDKITTNGTHLFYPHGKIELDSEELDIVLTRSEFNKYYRQNRKIHNFFYKMFLQYSVIFFGFSASDEYIQEILINIKNHEKSSETSQSRFLFRSLPVVSPTDMNQKQYLDLAELKEQEEHFTRLGIQVIWYDSSQEHKEMADMVSSWIDLQDKSQKDTSLGVNSGNV